MFYPLVTATCVILIALTMLLFLGPRIGDVMGDPLAFRMPSQGAQFWFDVAPWIVVGLFVAIVFTVFWSAWVRNPLDGGAGKRGLRFRLPFLGKLSGYAAKSGFATTLAMLIERGLPLPHSLQLAAAATDDRDIAGRIERMQSSAESGTGLAESVRAGEFLTPAMLWFLENGEASGTPARSLADIATIYRHRLDRGVDRMCFMVAPIGMLLTGLVVLWFAVAYLAPLFLGFQRALL